MKKAKFNDLRIGKLLGGMCRQSKPGILTISKFCVPSIAGLNNSISQTKMTPPDTYVIINTIKCLHWPPN